MSSVPCRHVLAVLALLIAPAGLPAQKGQSLGPPLSATSVEAHWVGTWATAPVATPNTAGAVITGEVLDQVLRISCGGSVVRITLTNELGTDPLRVSQASISSGETGDTPNAVPIHPLTFSGRSGIVIPPGAVAVSDPVSFPLPALSRVHIRLSLPAQVQRIMTVHSLSLEANHQSVQQDGSSLPMAKESTFSQWRFLKNVEVLATEKAGAAVVTLGDSITDGTHSTPDTDRRWPDVLAGRLQAESPLRRFGVLNEGISGNRVLHDGSGPNALARFDRDVLSQEGVRFLIVMESINDIGHTFQPRTPDDPVTTDAIIAGLQQLVERAHAHGILVYGATLTPFLGAGYSSPSGEAMRQTVNTWIRKSGQFDAVIDFDRLLDDPSNPGYMLPALDSGDHLHPNDAGYKAMGTSIDLKLFQR